MKATRGAFNNANSAIYELMDGMIGLRKQSKSFRERTGLEGVATKFGSNSLLAIRVLTAKLGFAYYYRETGLILPSAGAIVADIITNSQILEDRVPTQHQWDFPFTDLTERGRHPRQLLYRFGLLPDQSGGIFQFGLHENILLIAIATNDLSRHKASDDTEFVFRPGFAKLLRPPAQEARYSL